MAANFWASAQAAQLRSNTAQQVAHVKDAARGLSHAEIEQLTSHHIRYIRDLAQGSAAHGIRQRVAATACVFFRRFYLRNDFCAVDPRAVAPAALYLAAKVEETLLQARHLFHIMQKLAGTYVGMLPELEMKTLMDLEMALLEGLEYRLTVWHPYTDLAAYLQSAQITDIAQECWSVLNDSYNTDVLLQFPPHIVALGCLTVGAGMQQQDVRGWLEGLEVDLDQVYSAALKLTDMYDAERTGKQSDIGQLLARIRTA